MGFCPISGRECRESCPWQSAGSCVVHVIAYNLGYIAALLAHMVDDGGGVSH